MIEHVPGSGCFLSQVERLYGQGGGFKRPPAIIPAEPGAAGGDGDADADAGVDVNFLRAAGPQLDVQNMAAMHDAVEIVRMR